MEVDVLHVLGDAVNLDLGLVHHHLGVGSAHAVDDALGVLLVKEWPLPHIDADVHLGRAHVVQCSSHILLFFINQHFKVDINKPLALRRIHRLPLRLLNFHCLHFGAPLLTLLLDLLDASHGCFYIWFTSTEF